VYSLLVAAAGLGTRMAGNLPKALVPYRGRPLIEASIAGLVSSAAEVVIVARPEAVPHFEQHLSSDLLRKSRFVVQGEAAGTSWAVALGLRECRQPRTFAMWADHVGAGSFTKMQIADLLTRGRQSDIVVPVVYRQDPYAYLEIDADGSISAFFETRRGAARIASGWSDCGTFLLATKRVQGFLEGYLAVNEESDANFLHCFAPAARQGLTVRAMDMGDPELTVGINSQEDLLAHCARTQREN